LKDASTTGTTGDITAWNTGIILPQPDKDSSNDIDAMPCWLHSIEATPCRTRQRDTSYDTSQETSHQVFASHRSSRLPSVIPDFQDYQQPPTLTADYLARPTNGNSFTGVSHVFPLPTIHVQPYKSIDAKPLATVYRCQYHGSISTSNSVCIALLIVFAIYPKLLKLFYFTLLPIFHRNISPLL